MTKPTRNSSGESRGLDARYLGYVLARLATFVPVGV
jgi:hypothetical protein